ncbi:hypothetical protein MGH68_06260 [Erysipelothrix sp. D19-032]
MIESSMAMGLLLTYLSFYLGVVFLVTSFVILALQQLSKLMIIKNVIKY